MSDHSSDSEDGGGGYFDSHQDPPGGDDWGEPFHSSRDTSGNADISANGDTSGNADEDNSHYIGSGNGPSGDPEENGGEDKKVKGQKKRDRKAAKAKKEADKDLLPETVMESAAARAVKLDQRRKKNDDYVADLKHKGLHSISGEIDRCLKKVSEGVETFEDIWQKVHNATNTNQKEKYEADLKKEIKKLQRLRDQIKSWIASGEIKDKSTLVDTRKLIETQMERFKVVERETKTKAYSKEGLGAAQKLDPTTREREDLNGWLIASIDSMQLQMDQFECEIESILAAKKKKLDKDKQDRLDELKTSLERHRFHVGKLETLMRMLDNLAVDVNAVRYTSSLPQLRKFLSQVKKIKDDIDYYLESNQEPEFEENEFLYDDIEGLEEFDENMVGQPLGGLNAGDEEGLVGVDGTPALTTTSGNNSPISPVHSSDASDPEKRRKSSDDSSKVVRPVAMKANHSPSPGVKSVVGTPPKGVGTPNNSSPSSGLSNHVSSLSSLSSSPTHNYHNAKSISNSDSIEHNNSSAAGAFTSGGLSKSPSSNSTSNSGSTDGTTSLTTVNGVLENGSSNEDHSSPHTQMISSSTPLLGGLSMSGAMTLENGLISPPPLQQDTCTNNILLNSSSSIGSGMINNNNERSQQHHLFGDSGPSESTITNNNSSLLLQQQQLQHPSFLGQQTLAGFAAAAMAAAAAGGGGGIAAGVSNNLSESGFTTNISNLGVSNSSSLISNSSVSSNNNSSNSVVLGGSSNVIGLTSIVGGNQQNSAVVGGSSFNSSAAVSSLVNAATTTTASSGGGSVIPPGGLGYSGLTSNSNSSSGGGSGGISSHNSNSGILSQQQLQQLQQLQQQHQQQQQQQQGPTSQSGNSRDSTPISDYLRLHQSQDQMLLNRILTEPESMASLKSMAQDVLDRSGLTLGEHNSTENKMREAHIPPLLGVAPLGPVPLQKEHQFQFQMLDSAHCHVPVSADSERMRQFLPRNPYPTPHYYPQNPLTNSDTLEFFQRLSIETLFFIFYYLEGTKAQYLAAKVLKKQSWRFHTKYMMWFQRHEEPKVINEEYEQGTYIYFDIEKWGQRKKDGFVFEYRYLEDRELG